MICNDIQLYGSYRMADFVSAITFMALKTPSLYGLSECQRISDVTRLCHTLMSHVGQ